VDLSAPRGALAQGRYADAIAALDASNPATDEDRRQIAALRKDAVDGWSRGERERAGEAFVKARELPAGPERTAALRQVREQLAAINTRFPDNAYATQIGENLERVEMELAREGGAGP
jgi:MOSC domain-containing protein YiiM